MTTTVCPRCGKKVIEVKEIGLSGTLMIHGYVEMAPGLGLAPDACRISRAEQASGLKWTVSK